MNLQEHIIKVLEEESKPKKDFEVKSIKIIKGKNKWSDSKTIRRRHVKYVPI